MFSTIAQLPAREILLLEAPAFGVALLIAETAFKFRSFSLELIAFLITWLILGLAARQVARLVGFTHG
ncbi:MAG: hypothetical protein ACRDGV_09615 [Candidatus Limnocylindria bacterium]